MAKAKKICSICGDAGNFLVAKNDKIEEDKRACMPCINKHNYKTLVKKVWGKEKKKK